MTPEQSRIVATTISKYMPGAEDAIMRNRKIFALAQAKGKVTYNNSGLNVDWGIKYKRAPVQGYAEQDVLTFTQRDRWKRAVIDWRGMIVTDSITKKQREMNKNTEALIKIYGEITENLMDDMEEEFGNVVYLDGNLAANIKLPHGIESFMGYGAAQSGVPVMKPSDNYAGLATNLGDDGGAGGGTWSGTWPNGVGDTNYDFWSPLIVDYTNAAWPQTTKTWANTCESALRFGIIKARKNRSSMKASADVVIMEDEMFRQFLEKQSAKERIIFNRTDTKKATLLSLGYTDVANFEGTEITMEYGVPANVAYSWCFEYFELMSMQSKLFVADTDFSHATKSDRFSIDFLGNMKFKNVRHFTKWVAGS